MATVMQGSTPTVPIAAFLAVELTQPVLTAAQLCVQNTSHAVQFETCTAYTDPRLQKPEGQCGGCR